jgi:hypothetical protein
VRVVVLVPRRADNGRRDRLWSWVSARWRAEHPTWGIYEGHHDEGPFNRSKALNSAARDAGDWDVAIIADGDAFVDVEQMKRAVRKAKSTGSFVIAYERYNYLSRPMSDRILDGYLGNWWPGVEWSMTNTCSTMLAVPRGLWDTVGGFDEGFEGWGWEDCAFSVACAAFGGRKRVEGEVWHLWHPSSPENNSQLPEWQAGLARLNLYSACEEKRELVGPLLDQLGVR